MYDGATTVRILRWELLITKRSGLRVWHVWQSDVKQSLSHERVRACLHAFLVDSINNSHLNDLNTRRTVVAPSYVQQLPSRHSYGGCPIVRSTTPTTVISMGCHLKHSYVQQLLSQPSCPLSSELIHWVY
jgi:hypothetical protein